MLPDVGLGAREVLLDGPKNVFSIVASLQVVVVCLTMVVGFVGLAALVDVSAAALLVVVALFVVSSVLNSVLLMLASVPVRLCLIDPRTFSQLLRRWKGWWCACPW